MEGVEKRLLKLILVRRYRILILALVIVFLMAFSHAPYVNLFFDSYLFIFVVLLLTPLIIGISIRIIFIIALTFFCIALILWFIDPYGAQVLGNYIFIILFAGVVKAYLSP